MMSVVDRVLEEVPVVKNDGWVKDYQPEHTLMNLNTHSALVLFTQYVITQILLSVLVECASQN